MSFAEIILALLLLCVVCMVALLYRFFKLKAEHGRRLGELDEAKTQYSQLSDFLSSFSVALGGDTGVDGGLRCMARYVAGQLSADAIGVYEMRDGELRGAGIYGIYPLVHTDDPQVFFDYQRLLSVMQHERFALGSGLLGRTAQEKKVRLINDGSNDPRLSEFLHVQQLGGVMLAPLCRGGDGEPAGLICAVNSLDHNRFSRKDIEKFNQLAPQLILTLDLILAYGEMSRKERLDQELSFVRQLQYSLLPPESPEWEQFSVSAFSRPAKEVNGDFYDFVEIDEDRLLIVLGDATGKGLPACMLTAMTRSLIRAMADNFTNLSDFLRSVNRKLYRNTADGRFVTLGCCLLDRRNSLLEFGRAGHTELLTFVHNHIRVIAPDGTALGILPDDFAEFDTLCLAMSPGTSLLMFSDGITEAVNGEEEEFGGDRLRNAFESACREHAGPGSIIDRIISDVEAFAGTDEQGDDQTLVIIRHKG